jgi:hypothetical protein
MDVSLIVEKTDGTTAVTAITLTTGGTSDWTHKDGGYYEIEVTAAQNAEEGVGYIRGVCTGVLPFESAHYNIVKANVYDSWVKGTDVLHADITQLAGATQSLTDLKDFADAGYDPGTNKVQGVVLCDTTTTNTDMKGTDGANTTTPPTVTAIRQEMDANSTKMAPSQTLNDYKATGFNTVVPDVAGTAATPAEVATSLSNIHLDHLFAADYDPASKPGIATALLNELVESDGGVSRYTANALEQAPSAGTNPNVLINTTIASVSDQTHFVLTAGSNDDDAYKDQAIVIYDASDSDFPSIRVCNAYTGATKTVTLDSTPDFTIVAGDGCKAFVTAPGTTAPTVGQIRTEMEGAGYKLAIIEADTNELQTNQGAWATATGFSTHSAADVKTAIEQAGSSIAQILADTNELQTDWVNGGRLDALLDACNTTTPPTVGEIADQVWDEVLSGATHNIATSAGRRLREISAFAIHGGTAQAGATTSITLAAGASADDGVYNRNLLAITEGTGAGQTRQVADYNGTSKVVTVDREWRVSPDATSVYQITADNVFALVDQGNAQAGTATTITLRAYASSVDDTYLCNQVAIIAGTGRGQARLVGAYNGTTKVATICGDNWVTTPDASSVYVLMPYGTTCTSCIGTYALSQINSEADDALTDYGANTVTPDAAGVAPTADEIKTEVEQAGSSLALILADTGELQTDWVNGGRLDLLIDLILGDTAELQGNQGDWATATSVTVSDKTGFALSGAGVDAILDENIEGTHSMREMMRLFASMLVGKVTGGGTTAITFRDIDDSKNRIVMTVTDVGNRTGVVLTED